MLFFYGKSLFQPPDWNLHLEFVLLRYLIYFQNSSSSSSFLTRISSGSNALFSWQHCIPATILHFHTDRSSHHFRFKSRPLDQEEDHHRFSLPHFLTQLIHPAIVTSWWSVSWGQASPGAAWTMAGCTRASTSPQRGLMDFCKRKNVRMKKQLLKKLFVKHYL